MTDDGTVGLHVAPLQPLADAGAPSAEGGYAARTLVGTRHVS